MYLFEILIRKIEEFAAHYRRMKELLFAVMIEAEEESDNNEWNEKGEQYGQRFIQRN